MTATVRVRRKKAFWVNRGRSFAILINDVERGIVKNGSSVDIEVEPGEFVIQARIDWGGSPALTSTVGDGEIACFVVCNGSTTSVAHEPMKYLTLEQEE